MSYTLTSARKLSHVATITTSSGPQIYTWTQELSYNNTQHWEGVTPLSSNSSVYQVTSGTCGFSSGTNAPSITNSFQYPISVVQRVSYPVDYRTANSSLYGALSRSLISDSVPIIEYLTFRAIFSASSQRLATSQAGWALEHWNNTYYEQAG
jgi:hypothetical protein